jgi:tripartite-type tricarboxylate transporter receptor subunit TctC
MPSLSRAVLAALALATVPLSLSAAEEQSFRGKKIDVIIGSSAGGGTDGTTRLIGRYLEKYLPGNPEMVYRNMPGGAGTKALNYVAASVKPDGLTWIGGASNHIDPNVLIKPHVKYNPTKFAFFGGVSRGGSVIFIRKDKLANLTDRSLPPVIVGELDGNRGWGQIILWGSDVLGWNVKFVVGYPGTSYLLLAMRRGEVDMMGTSNVAQVQDFLRTGNFVGVVQRGEAAGGKIVPREAFATIPVFTDLMAGKTSGTQKDSFEFWSMLDRLDKWYALPPGTPPDMVAAYRQAYRATVADPEFLRNAHLQFSDGFNPERGEDIARMVDKTSYPPKALTDFIQRMKVRHGLPAQPLSDEDVAKLAKEKGLDKLPSVSATLQEVRNGGRAVVFLVNGEPQTAEVSSGRTAITIAGQKSDRASLQPGMNCEISYPGNQQEAAAIACK